MTTLGFLTDETVATYTPPAPFIQPPAEVISAAFVARAHRLGLRVHPWTVNEREEMRRLIALGVDGIFTDDPVMLGELLANTAG